MRADRPYYKLLVSWTDSRFCSLTNTMSFCVLTLTKLSGWHNPPFSVLSHVARFLSCQLSPARNHTLRMMTGCHPPPIFRPLICPLPVFPILRKMTGRPLPTFCLLCLKKEVRMSSLFSLLSYHLSNAYSLTLRNMAGDPPHIFCPVI